jgi:aspartate/glutamate racemase
MLTGSNYKEWKDMLDIILGCFDLDIVLQQAKPPVPAADSPENIQNAHARWILQSFKSEVEL